MRGLVCLVCLICGTPAWADFYAYGQGGLYGSKWGPPEFGQPAVVTWGFMQDGTIVDPNLNNNIKDEVTGGSNLSLMRSNFDATYGAGAFDAIIQSALDTWSAAAGISFVGPMTDSGSPIGSSDSITAGDPDIRIGAFMPVEGSGFAGIGAVGFGPPGNAIDFPDPFAGDVMFNLSAEFVIQEGDVSGI